MSEEGLLLRDLQEGARFRTLLTDRVGTLRQKNFRELLVTWADQKPAKRVHRNLLVDPWPREG